MRNYHLRISSVTEHISVLVYNLYSRLTSSSIYYRGQ